jgi:hypothetical protein
MLRRIQCGSAERRQAPGPTRNGCRSRAAGSAHADPAETDEAATGARLVASTATSTATSSTLGSPRTTETGTTECSDIKILIFRR